MLTANKGWNLKLRRVSKLAVALFSDHSEGIELRSFDVE